MRSQHPITCTCGACRHATPDWRGEGTPEYADDEAPLWPNEPVTDGDGFSPEWPQS